MRKALKVISAVIVVCFAVVVMTACGQNKADSAQKKVTESQSRVMHNTGVLCNTQKSGKDIEKEQSNVLNALLQYKSVWSKEVKYQSKKRYYSPEQVAAAASAVCPGASKLITTWQSSRPSTS